MDENTNNLATKRNAIILFVSIFIALIIAISVVTCATHKDYEYSIESYQLVSNDGSMAQVNLRVKNKSNQQQIYYVYARAYKQANDNLVGGGSRYIIAEPNSNEVYSFIVDTSVSYVDLFDTYVKIEDFRETHLNKT